MENVAVLTTEDHKDKQIFRKALIMQEKNLFDKLLEISVVICTGDTLFALVLHLNCTALSQSESSNFFFTYFIIVN